jgi:ATP-binding cassette, subfamily B, multidrug efflux pump
MKYVLAYLAKHKKDYIFILVVLLLVDIAQLAIPLIIRQAINNISEVQSMDKLTISAIWLLVFALIVTGGRFAYGVSIRKMALTFNYENQIALYKKYLQLPDSFFHTHEIGDLMSRISHDTLSIRRFMIMGLIAAIDIVFMGVASLMMMIYLSPSLSLVAILPLIVLIFITRYVSRHIHGLFKKIQQTFGAMTSSVRETLIGMKVIRTFTRENYYLQRFADLCQGYLKLNMNLAKLMGVFHPSITLLVSITTLIVYFVGGKLVIDKTITLGNMIAFSQYIQTLSWPMMAFGFVVNLYQRANISLKRIEEILNTPSTDALQKIRLTPTLKATELKFSKLSYTYPESPKAILRDLTLDIQQGQIIGITGPTGSGKTTLISLLLRIWEAPGQSIYLDGYRIDTIELDHYRSLFSYVSQDTFLFSATVRENIAFGKPDASMEEIERVSSLAEFNADIHQFEKGYDTLIGERGVTLSGGQKQRLAIARALLMNRPVLILDDPLSAVDPETEEKIVNNLKEYLKEKDFICIIITHKITGLAWADKIVVLKDGQVAENGKHDELLALQGYYSYLYKKQFLEGWKELKHDQ